MRIRIVTDMQVTWIIEAEAFARLAASPGVRPQSQECHQHALDCRRCRVPGADA